MRRATLDDVPRLIEMGIAFHAESRHSKFRLNVEKVRAAFERMVGHERAIVLVSGDPVCAMFVGGVSEFWWGDDLESEDILIYVEPARRGGMHAIRLVKEYRDIARRMGVADIRINTGAGINTERTGKFFERLGGEPVLLGFTIH